MRGRPALGLIHKGMPALTAASSATTRSMSASDRPQLAPMAATPSGAIASTILVGLNPIMVRVPWSKLKVTASGSALARRIPSMAASASSSAKNVSSKSRSTPPSSSAAACSR